MTKHSVILLKKTLIDQQMTGVSSETHPFTSCSPIRIFIQQKLMKKKSTPFDKYFLFIMISFYYKYNMCT